MIRRNEILATLKDLPALPKAAVEVTRLVQDPDVSPNTLAKAIQYDPGLCSNILRIANSAYFGTAKKVSSIKEAINRLGIKQIHQLVIGAVTAPLASQAVEGYDLPAGGLWGHSVAVAVGAEQAAKVLQRKAPGHTFTAALLHDIGKIVLGTFIKVDVGPIFEVMEGEGLAFEEAEERVLGINHAEVGYELLSEWGLPDEITGIVRWHHQPEKYEGDPLVIDLVHAADVLSITCGIGTGMDGLSYKSSALSTKRLGLRPTAMEAIVCGMLGELEEVKTLFGG